MKTLIVFLIFIAVSLFFNNSIVLAEENLVKEPNVSGTFYPSDKNELATMIDNLLAEAQTSHVKKPIYGIIAPHAGYIYSGKVTAAAYKTIFMKNYTTVVILSPSHYHSLKKAALYRGSAFKTPLGLVSLDIAFTNKLLQHKNLFQYSNDVFNNEHAIEVQIPFLQKCLKNFSIVPVIISGSSFSRYDDISDVLVKLIAEREDILIIASTDMSHFHNQIKAKEIDKVTLSLINENDPQKLFTNTLKGSCELCGLGPVITLMLTMKKLGIQAKLLNYATSADNADSSTDRVVGYSSIIYIKSDEGNQSILSKGDQNMLSIEQKKELLAIARTTIQEYLKTGKRYKPQTNDRVFLTKSGAFVTLKKNEMLRGCIGRVYSDEPLIKVICDMAIAAATGDPRFPSVSERELEMIDIEISVMSPIEKITDISTIKVGTHGLIIKKGFTSGLLLPQVAAEYGWNTNQFLEQTCVKAGLYPDEWKKGAEIFIFSAEVFGEKEQTN